ncbi:DUF3592 domain-containing protein [Undibacterium pigrum]|uniref:DUF3592 domain-containing protein n=1 Tax=Undibacterium pigrum TaxID=401470 RepID=UPI0014754D6F|nr:DUF3592 domain-containing protein [Undibacterium pigrum]
MGIYFAILFLFIAVAWTFWSVVELFRASQSVHWPTVQAKVRVCKVQRYFHAMTGYKDNIGQAWSFQMLYDYSVHGQAYQGYRPFFCGGPSKRVARNIVAKYPEGSTITISYHPEKPGLSVLIPGVTRFAWGTLLAGPLLLVPAYIAWRLF